MKVLLLGPLDGELATAGRIAQANGAALLQASTIATALALLRGTAAVDLVLADITLDIASLIGGLRAERMATQIVACGIDADPAAAAAAIRAGAREFLPLPPDPDLIAAILRAAAGEGEGPEAVIAQAPAMQAALARAEQVARSDASVLITGESGTGKEVMARHIHAQSRRARFPYIGLNCAAIPEALLESELFGHEKGAFSGAQGRRLGKFEAAEGGTLLLDEISEMDIRLQAKLLRALQEREIDRLGGTSPVKIDVRILATTNRDMAREVAEGRFREDLWFRLNVITLRLPPLRERPEDIFSLATHFAHRFAGTNGMAYRPLSAAAQALLMTHSWRGNVRELENTIHRAVLLAEGTEIGPEAIELAGGPAPPTPEAPAQAAAPTPSITALVGRSMADVERDLILGTLGHTLGNRTHAAVILGISIRALRNKLRDYAAHGIAVPPPGTGVAA